MTDKTMEHRGIMGGDWFKLIYSRKSDNNLQFFLDQFNINDYYIYKSSAHFRRVNIEDLYEFRYSGYIFFEKEKYDYKEIDEWIDFLKDIGNFLFFDKPFPPVYVKEKIRIIK